MMMFPVMRFPDRFESPETFMDWMFAWMTFASVVETEAALSVPIPTRFVEL